MCAALSPPSRCTALVRAGGGGGCRSAALALAAGHVAPWVGRAVGAAGGRPAGGAGREGANKRGAPRRGGGRRSASRVAALREQARARRGAGAALASVGCPAAGCSSDRGCAANLGKIGMLWLFFFIGWEWGSSASAPVRAARRERARGGGGCALSAACRRAARSKQPAPARRCVVRLYI